EQWLRELPDVRALARATPQRVLKLWEGLGYYTRARNLQKAAQLIVTQHGGRFPETFDAVLALPGIGRYTAGAICSIAFNQPAPILDGNVIRVLTRVFGIRQDPREKATNTRLWRLAEQLVEQTAAQPTPPPSAFCLLPFHTCSVLNQSLMELGATVCTRRQPQCANCPVQRSCVAFARGLVNALPNLGRRAPPTARRFVAFVVERRGRFLVRQRAAAVVNARLWEFPNIEVAEPGSNLTKLARRQLGLPVGQTKRLCVIQHSITRFRISLEARLAQRTKPAARHRPDGRWLLLRDLEKLAFPSAHRRILDALIERAAGARGSDLARGEAGGAGVLG
ncbi:MAG TPA: NUDIX domain-containing protein, partial [Verrucomicrobiae bacterium]